MFTISYDVCKAITKTKAIKNSRNEIAQCTYTALYDPPNKSSNTMLHCNSFYCHNYKELFTLYTENQSFKRRNINMYRYIEDTI